MKTTFTKILAFSFLAIQFSGCGSSTGTSDNIEILNSTTLPEIGVFTSSGTYNSGIPYTAAAPYWRFNTSSYGNFMAPARGIIGEVGVSSIIPNSSFVTIIHSGRVATRVHGITSLTVRPGDGVAVTNTVGIFLNSTSIAFQVFVDGVSVCPLSYVSAALRQNLFTNPCQ